MFDSSDLERVRGEAEDCSGEGEVVDNETVIFDAAMTVVEGMFNCFAERAVVGESDVAENRPEESE